MEYTNFHPPILKPSLSKKLQRWSIVTLLTLYSLILAGSIVRSTGAGMGCPDWPKCFGCWIPPTQEYQLPTNYQNIFHEKRIKKSKKIAKMMSYLGLKQIAQSITKKNQQQPQAIPFNFAKAWTEYINRILGIFVGICITIVCVLSWPYRNIRWVGLLVLCLVILQGGLGAWVVATHLLAGLVTLHMLIALLIIACMLLIIHRNRPCILLSHRYKPWIILSLLLTGIQIFWGTKVRALVDQMLIIPDWRATHCILTLGNTFLFHRFFSLIILVCNGYIIFRCLQLKQWRSTYWAIALGFMLVLNIILGMILAYCQLPVWAQPLHLMLTTLFFSVQWYGFLSCSSSQQ